MSKKQNLKPLGTVLVLMLVSSVASVLFAENYAENILQEGNVFGEMRYRYEHVEQEGIAHNANASTVRTNLGFKTAVHDGFQVLAEGQLIQNIGSSRFNDTTNGKTTYPVVADPSDIELNQLWVSWDGVPDSLIKVGRQKMNLDNQRFIGAVGWRQNDQTFDAIQLTNKSIQNLDLMYSYIDNVNRIFGDDQGAKVHIAHAKYHVTDWLDLAGYGYWIGFDRLAANSSKTFGVRVTGQTPMNESWKMSYEAEIATQSDHGDNTANYDESYYHISPSVSGHGVTFKAGYEVLGGNGTNSFRTPLATLHKFNGWADAFLTTPGAGLEDAYLSASYKLSDIHSVVDGTTIKAVYHDFNSNDSSNGDFGNELDMSIGKSFKLPESNQPFKKVSTLLKYANYNGDSGVADRQKIWLQFGAKF